MEKPTDSPIEAVKKTSSSEENLAIEWDATDEKRIRNRMDVRIVPTVFCLYLLCFIDRANVGYFLTILLHLQDLSSPS